MSEVSKNSVSFLQIHEEDAGQRLDNYLTRICKGIPKGHIYRIIRGGEIRINGKRVDVAYRLQVDDCVRIPPIRIAQSSAPLATAAKLQTDLPVVYEDPALLVLNKPSGIAVHGGSGVSFGLIEALRQQRPEARFLELAHRLDRETSGLLLVGKKRSALTALHDMFRAAGEQRGADKRYLALVCGRWMDEKRHVRLPLYKYLLPSGERRVRVAEDGKVSHTIFRLVARWQKFSLLEAELKSGRTHQIRVHCAHLGFPLAGDDKYGQFDLNKALEKQGLKRLFLHAWKIAFAHPLSGVPLTFETPLPDDLRTFLHTLSTTETQDYGQKF